MSRQHYNNMGYSLLILGGLRIGYGCLEEVRKEPTPIVAIQRQMQPRRHYNPSREMLVIGGGVIAGGITSLLYSRKKK